LTGYLWVRGLSGFGPAATFRCYSCVTVAGTDAEIAKESGEREYDHETGCLRAA